MTASTKKVTAKVAAAKAERLHTVRSERAKAVAADRAKAKAAKAAAPSLKAVAKATTKVLDKPKATPAGLKPIAQAAAAEARTFLAKLDAKAAKPAAKAGNTEKLGAAIQAIADEKAAAAKAPNGVKGRIIAMIAADGGTSAAEVCSALGWVKAGATIGRAIKLAGFKVAKVRDADGVLRYSREG